MKNKIVGRILYKPAGSYLFGEYVIADVEIAYATLLAWLRIWSGVGCVHVTGEFNVYPEAM